MMDRLLGAEMVLAGLAVFGAFEPRQVSGLVLLTLVLDFLRCWLNEK